MLHCTHTHTHTLLVRLWAVGFAKCNVITSVHPGWKRTDKRKCCSISSGRKRVNGLWPPRNRPVLTVQLKYGLDLEKKSSKCMLFSVLVTYLFKKNYSPFCNEYNYKKDLKFPYKTPLVTCFIKLDNKEFFPSLRFSRNFYCVSKHLIVSIA